MGAILEKDIENSAGGSEPLLLVQWQTCVESANAMSQRRDVINGLFVTLCLAIVTGTAAFWDYRAIALLAIGMVVCIAWLLYLQSFRKLNQAKFEAINAMEKQLPKQPFSEEWDTLQKDSKYRKETTIEKILPITFIVLYVALAALLLLV